MTDGVSIACAACGTRNPPGASRCSGCAAALAGGGAASGTAERKQVTVLFSDLSGFAALSERLDPEETRQITTEVFGRAAAIVERHEGRIEKFIGDAWMALFGVPVSHEDDPVRALQAATELHAAVAALAPQVQARCGVALVLHSGVNTGVVVTGELQWQGAAAGPLGDTINLAARLMGSAPSGEIWVGPATRRLAEAFFDFDDLGLHDFKGKAQPVAVARLRAPRSRQQAPLRRFSTGFVGRQAELGALLGAAEKMRDGLAQAVAVCGEAGGDKTRLASEFRDRAGAGGQWVEGRAYPYAQAIAYAPLIDLIARQWRIDDSDPAAQVRAKLRAGAEARSPSRPRRCRCSCACSICCRRAAPSSSASRSRRGWSS